MVADHVVERGHATSVGAASARPCHHVRVAEGYWQAVLAGGADVPADRPLDDLTAELVGMLGDPDPQSRDQATTVLDRWISHGVYDDLLLGIGDGVCAGLRVRLGEDGTDSVLRRSFSARVLAAVIARDNERHLLTDDAVLRWGDRASGWLLRERDLRGFVPGHGWSHAVAHGADLLGVLARSRHFHAAELPVLLDVVAERLLLPTAYVLHHGEDDRLAYAVMAVLHRDLVDEATLEAWLARLGAGIRRPADAEFRHHRVADPRGRQHRSVRARAARPARDRRTRARRREQRRRPVRAPTTGPGRRAARAVRPAAAGRPGAVRASGGTCPEAAGAVVSRRPAQLSAMSRKAR